jgi:hypothetical protein
MSKNIVDSVIELCNSENLQLGFIPSRRQVEYSGGYVNRWDTKNFISYVNSRTDNVVLQRDHGGRGQGDLKRNDYFSFASDAYCGFDLIHIDPWKEYLDIDEVVKETAENIRLCNRINPECCYEVGTEEAIHKYSHEELDYFLRELKQNLGSLWGSVVYAVIQAGTRLEGTKNIGKFDEERCKKMIEVCKKHGLLSKEHNGDYLTAEGIKKRFNIGLDGLNIAPEFGVLETKIIIDSIKKQRPELFQEYFELCYNSKRWVKWLPRSFLSKDLNEEDKLKIIEVCGHYVFADEKFIKIKNSLKDLDVKIKEELKAYIKEKVLA